MTYIHMPSIKRVLEAGPFSDREVAERLEVAESTVARWRRGGSTPAVAFIQMLYTMHVEYVRELNKGLTAMDRQMYGLKLAEGVDTDETEAYREVG